MWEPFREVVEDYFRPGLSELVPTSDTCKSHDNVYYLPMHAVHKLSSSTNKLRVVFDASAKTQTGVSLNDTLMVGPTIFPPLGFLLRKWR